MNSGGGVQLSIDNQSAVVVLATVKTVEQAKLIKSFIHSHAANAFDVLVSKC